MANSQLMPQIETRYVDIKVLSKVMFIAGGRTTVGHDSQPPLHDGSHHGNVGAEGSNCCVLIVCSSKVALHRS